MAPSLPLVHPAVKASAHLLPGISNWSSRTIEQLSKLGLNDIKGADYSVHALKAWYAATDPLQSALSACAALTALTFLLGEVSGNWSIVDRVWTFLPLAYSAHFALHSRYTGSASVSTLFGTRTASTGFNHTDQLLPSLWAKTVPTGVDERMFLVLAVQVCWCIRLSYNTLRRGFFDFSSEDYRWPIIRARMPKYLYTIFDFTIVALMQNVLLASTALPQFLLLTATRAYHPTSPPNPLDNFDFAIAGLFLLNLIIEQTADTQQQIFQNWKHGPGHEEGKGARLLKGYNKKQIERAEGDLRRGFVTSGLWAWSRHPNFICEQLNFWILPLFTIRATVPNAVFSKIWSAARASFDLKTPIYIVDAVKLASPHLLNYAWFASIGMSAILVGSTVLLTEPISSSKYPKYRQYQRRVGLFFPTTTILKGLWLGITGNLKQVNEDVYGSGKVKTK